MQDARSQITNNQITYNLELTTDNYFPYLCSLKLKIMTESKKRGSPRKRHGDFSKFIEKKSPKKPDKKKPARKEKPGIEDKKEDKFLKPRDSGKKPAKFNKLGDKPGRGRSDKLGKTGKSGRSDKSVKSDRAGRAAKPGRSKPRNDGLIRLNKYIADAGICSRREADNLIEAGVIKVNGKVVTELGTRISPTDKVIYGDQSLSREKMRYVMLNKPKGFITTMDDPYERKTVVSLIQHACEERIYPVGRLDRNTTGLLLFTNDGDLAQRLAHPRHGIKKIYHVVLNKALTKNDLVKIGEGFELDDGFIKVDNISYAAGAKDKKEIGIELHSGRNRIVRRIFEELGYNVTRLDRVAFAGLTKKDIPRGKWRHLEEKEVNFLKMIK